MLSIQSRQAFSKLILPIYFFCAVGFVLLGLTEGKTVAVMRMRVTDAVAPIYVVASAPREFCLSVISDITEILHVQRENALLRVQNENLRQWYRVAQRLSTENAELKANLNWIVEPSTPFVTGRVVRDSSGLYDRSVLLMIDSHHLVHPGDVARDTGGMIGRVTEVGRHTARILLITDQSSRLPVTLTSSHGQAIMIGDGSLYPRLRFYRQDAPPIEGERVVTGSTELSSNQSDVGAPILPEGLALGVVHYFRKNDPVVVPSGSVNQPTIVRVLETSSFALHGPDAPGRLPSKILKSSRAPTASGNLMNSRSVKN